MGLLINWPTINVVILLSINERIVRQKNVNGRTIDVDQVKQNSITVMVVMYSSDCQVIEVFVVVWIKLGDQNWSRGSEGRGMMINYPRVTTLFVTLSTLVCDLSSQIVEQHFYVNDLPEIVPHSMCFIEIHRITIQTNLVRQIGKDQTFNFVPNQPNVTSNKVVFVSKVWGFPNQKMIDLNDQIKTLTFD